MRLAIGSPGYLDYARSVQRCLFRHTNKARRRTCVRSC